MGGEGTGVTVRGVISSSVQTMLEAARSSIVCCAPVSVSVLLLLLLVFVLKEGYPKLGSHEG